MMAPLRYRAMFAPVGLLLLLLAPAPGERADDPGDASAEIAVVRGAAPQVTWLWIAAPTFSHHAAARLAVPHLPGLLALDDALAEGPSRVAAPALQPLFARPPPRA